MKYEVKLLRLKSESPSSCLLESSRPIGAKFAMLIDVATSYYF
jgi:hypothetical protein